MFCTTRNYHSTSIVYYSLNPVDHDNSIHSFETEKLINVTMDLFTSILTRLKAH
jgi:hypothetical protein